MKTANITAPAAEQLATFAPDALTIAGETFPAGYSRSYRSDLVHVLVEMDGQRYRIDIPTDHPAHAAALAALAGETAQADEAASVDISATVAQGGEDAASLSSNLFHLISHF